MSSNPSDVGAQQQTEVTTEAPMQPPAQPVGEQQQNTTAQPPTEAGATDASVAAQMDPATAAYMYQVSAISISS